MSPSRSGFRVLPHGLELLYEDRDILVVSKPAGLLTISTEKEKQRTAYYTLMDYVRKGNSKSRNRIFIVHRLDKDTSGVLVLAKTGEAKRTFQGQWEGTKKRYLAIVHGRLEKKKDTLTSYLTENESGFVHSTPSPARGKLSHTAYTVLSELNDLSLVEVELITGRKNQIRVHFADAGHPVAGDKKYAKAKDGFPRLALHAWSIGFFHPHTGAWLEFTAKAPNHFARFASAIEKVNLPGTDVTPVPQAPILPRQTPPPSRPHQASFRPKGAPDSAKPRQESSFRPKAASTAANPRQESSFRTRGASATAKPRQESSLRTRGASTTAKPRQESPFRPKNASATAKPRQESSFRPKAASTPAKPRQDSSFRPKAASTSAKKRPAGPRRPRR